MIVAVQAASLEVLEKAEVPPAQARAIVQAIEIEIAGAKDTLTTKHDLLLLRSDLQKEMGELRGEMGELRGEMGELRGEMGELRTELRSEMTGMRHALELRVEALRTEIHASASSSLRQMYGALLGQMAVLLGVAYFFVTHVPR
jgi:predicted nuclease with TOPRIM domain